MENGLVLIVDDRAQSRKQIGDEFRERGYRIVEAKNGDDGWRMFQSHSPDAVVTDMRMPQADGMELLERIRSQHSVPVFCLTAYPELDSGLLAMRRGAQYYYRWPQDLEMLVDDVDAILTRAKAPRPPGPDEPEISLSDLRKHGKLKTDEERRSAIVAALRKTRGNVGQAAELLKISRRTLYHWLDRYGVRTRDD